MRCYLITVCEVPKWRSDGNWKVFALLKYQEVLK